MNPWPRCVELSVALDDLWVLEVMQGSWKNRTWLAPDNLEKHYTKIQFYQLWPEPKCENTTQRYSIIFPTVLLFRGPEQG